MPAVVDALRANTAYAYVVVGLVWAAVAYLISSYLVLWPVIALVAGGVLLKSRPKTRLSWAWASSAAVLGLLLSGWQVYASAGLVSGSFAAVATASISAFAILGAIHLLLLYLSNSAPAEST